MPSEVSRGWWYVDASFNGIIHFNTGLSAAKQGKGVFIHFKDANAHFMIDGICQLSIPADNLEDLLAMCDEFCGYLGLINATQKTSLRELITECFY